MSEVPQNDEDSFEGRQVKSPETKTPVRRSVKRLIGAFALSAAAFLAFPASTNLDTHPGYVSLTRRRPELTSHPTCEPALYRQAVQPKNTENIHGISIYGGLEDYNWKISRKSVDAQEVAAAKYWYADTLRLQVAPLNLFRNMDHEEGYNTDFIKELDREVCEARRLGIKKIVINANTLNVGYADSPTTDLVKFWKIIAERYKNEPDIIFDLFNEPRVFKVNGTNTMMRPARVLNLWKSGGKVMQHGRLYDFIGMQQLVDGVRKIADNEIWVEGPYIAKGLPDPQHLIKGSGITYSIHHRLDINHPETWGRMIDNFVKHHKVVDGEISQYSSTRPECKSLAYHNAPRLLRYLEKEGIGVVVWTLQDNVLVQGSNHKIPVSDIYQRGDPTNPELLKTPNHLTSNYTCSKQTGEGIGRLIMSEFKKANGR